MTFHEIFMHAAASFASRRRPISSMTFDDIVDWRLKDIAPAVIARLEDFPAIGLQTNSEHPSSYYLAPHSGATELLVFHSCTVQDKAKKGWVFSPSRVMLSYRLSIPHDTGAL